MGCGWWVAQASRYRSGCKPRACAPSLGDGRLPCGGRPFAEASGFPIIRTDWRMVLLAILVLLVPGFSAAQTSARVDSVPSALLGEFVDDYGARHTIERETWVHGEDARYHILEWDVASRVIIARNDDDNPSDGGLWTRIDWVLLESGSYQWAYCYAVYQAATARAARLAPDTRRDTPRSGCNGFPLSRMRRFDP